MFDLDPHNPRTPEQRRDERIGLARNWIAIMLSYPLSSGGTWRCRWQCQITSEDFVEVAEEHGLNFDASSAPCVLTIATSRGEDPGHAS